MLPQQKPAFSAPLLTVTQAAQQLGIGRSYAYTLVDQGSIPTVQLGTRAAPKLRVRQQDLDAFIEARITKARP